MYRLLANVVLLSVFLDIFAQVAWSQSPYVIFGGTSPVVRTRIDPIVNPGSVSRTQARPPRILTDLYSLKYGSHLHDVFGGSGFSVNYDYNQQIQSNCTTLEITQDFSNYWVVSPFVAFAGAPLHSLHTADDVLCRSKQWIVYSDELVIFLTLAAPGTHP